MATPLCAGRYLKVELVEALPSASEGGLNTVNVYFNGMWKMAPAPGQVQKEAHAAYKMGHWISYQTYKATPAFLADVKNYNS